MTSEPKVEPRKLFLNTKIHKGNAKRDWIATDFVCRLCIAVSLVL
jgi:hypothetical protein